MHKNRSLFNLSNLLNNERASIAPDHLEKWRKGPHELKESQKIPQTSCSVDTCCWSRWEQVCQSSNLHGLKYVGLPGHILERIFFGVWFLIGTAASVYLIVEAFNKYAEFPTFVTFQENDIQIESIPFPAVTICNVNNIRQRKVTEFINAAVSGTKMNLSKEAIEKARQSLYFMDHVCQATSASLTSKFIDPNDDLECELSKIIRQTGSTDGLDLAYNTNFKKMLLAATQPCSEMILLCLWQNKEQNCSELFTETTTDSGKCCTFNMAPASLLYYDSRNFGVSSAEEVRKWNLTELHTEALLSQSRSYSKDEYPRRVSRPGLLHGLSILVDPDIAEYYCAASDSVGFQLSTHLPNMIDTHILDYGEGIGPNSETFIKIKVDVTAADEQIRSLDPNERNCYFTGEYPLTYYTTYTIRNCLDECYTRLTIEYCNCTQYFMPKNNESPICKRPDNENEVGCITQIEKFLVDKKYTIRDYCKQGKPTCTDITYHQDTTSRYIRQDEDIWAHDNDVRNSSQWSKKKVSIIHIYLDEDFIQAKVRKRLTRVTDLIASIGGQLGLCLGFSVLSAVEILYLIIVRVCGKSILAANMKLKRKLNNFHGADARGSGQGVHGSKMVSTFVTVQPRSTSTHTLLPYFYPEELAPRFAMGDYLRYY